MGALGALSCGPGADDLVPVSARDSAASSRPLLLITPQTPGTRPILDTETLARLEAVSALTTASAQATDVLRDAVATGNPAVVRAAAEKAAELLSAAPTGDPARADLGLIVVSAAASDVDDLQDAVDDALGALGATGREVLLERGVGSTAALEQRGVALLWPRLLGDSAEPDARAARIASLMGRLPPAIAFEAVARSCGEVPAGVLATLADAGPAGRAASAACALQGGAEQVPAGPLVAFLPTAPGAVARAVAASAEHVAAADREALAAALSALVDTAPEGSGVALAEARAALGEGDGFASLAVFARAGRPGERMASLAALVRLGERRRLSHASLAPALERAAEAPESSARARVAEALGLLDDGRVVPLITLLARDGSASVRLAAVYAAGRSGNPKLVKVLVEHGILDSSDAVQEASYAALEHLVHEHPLPPPSMVSEWLTHPEPLEGRTFWGRDHVRWREWYQSR